MNCLQCKTKLQKHNKARSKLGAGLPYCINCINAYNEAKAEEKKAEALRKKLMGSREEIDLSEDTIRSLTTDERSTLKYMLMAEGYTQAEIEQEWREMGLE